MSRITQEFYCTKSGGGCGGYFIVRLNPQMNWIANIICPNCKHVHQRTIQNGEIVEVSRFSGKPTEDIETTLAAFSKEPRMHRKCGERDAAVAKSSREFLDESIADRFGFPT